jgi:putative protease
MLRTPELLLPAGSLDKMRAAYDFGADAVYAGQPRYSLRARNNEFRLEQLQQGIQEAHARGKKLFVTSNLIAHNDKIRTYLRDIEPVIEMQARRIIMADPGLIMMVKEKWPEQVPIHLSVQANTTNWAAVKFWQKMGVQRIILSRELSLDEIEKIRQECPDMELEVFVHGALCIAYSGRCLLSGYFNHRDPNQGTCTNACRWDYKTPRRRHRPHHGRSHPAEDGRRLQLRGRAAKGRAIVSTTGSGQRHPKADQGVPARRSGPPRRAHAHHGRRARHLHHEQQGPARGGARGERLAQDRRRFAQDRRPHQEPVLRGPHRPGVPPRHRRRRGRPPLQPRACCIELEGLANRGYTGGLLERRPANDYQNYITGHSVTSAASTWARCWARPTAWPKWIETMNRFAVGNIDRNHPPAPGNPVRVRLPLEARFAGALLARRLPQNA